MGLLRRGAVAAAILLSASVAAADAQTPSVDSVTAVGTARVKPVPTDRNSNDAIASAVRTAKHQAIPAAIANARDRAVLLAAAGHLQLGALLGVADATSQSVFFGPYGDDGTFGPGRFCGQVARYRIVRHPNGRITRKRLGRHRVCRVPTYVSASEAVTYAATPTPG